MIIVEPRYSHKSRIITILILFVATILAVLLPFLVRARPEGPHPTQQPIVSQLTEPANITKGGGTNKALGAEGDDVGEGPGESQVATLDYDIIVRGGTLIGESRIFGAGADIGIRDGYVYAIGDLAGATAEKEIDAAGIKYAIVDGHLAFAAGQRAGDRPGEQEGEAIIVKGGTGGKATTDERSDA